MANLKEIRNRISSVSSTKQITAAMKMVSAAKLRKAQNVIITLKPYANKIAEVLNNVTASIEDLQNMTYSADREIRKVLLIVISSNRGLCGAFNTNVIKKVQLHIENNYKNLNSKGAVEILAIGKKAYETLNKRGYKIFAEHNKIYENLNYNSIMQISDTLMKMFVDEKFDKIEIIYNSFKNVAIQELKDEQYLPLKLSSQEKVTTEYIYEPDKQKILEKLIPQVLSLKLYTSVLDSFTAEHGARMTAMHKATDNATDLIKELTLTYNKARQAAITKEILEIVGGAEALNG